MWDIAQQHGYCDSSIVKGNSSIVQKVSVADCSGKIALAITTMVLEVVQDWGELFPAHW